jgi:peptide/nickel transport system substrate-binding protein
MINTRLHITTGRVTTKPKVDQMQIKKLAAIPATAALMLAAACGGGGSTEDPGEGAESLGEAAEEAGSVGEAQDPEAVGPARSPEGAEEGGTLTMLTAVAPTTLDPTRAYYTDSTAILNLVTRGLTGFQRQEDGSMTLVPDMATDLGRPSEDGLSWEFTLKDGIRYNNGDEVTAEDLAYAVKRSFAQDVLTEGPTYQNEFLVDGDKYKGPYADPKGEFGGVEVVDDKTIRINLTKEFADLPYFVSFPMFTGIPEELDTKLGYEREIAATGPYMIEEYVPSRSLTLVKNPEWDPETDPIRNQLPDTWEFRFSQDSNQLQERIIADNGEDQTTATYDDILASKYRQLTSMEGGTERLVKGTSPCTAFQYLDTRKLPDVNVRKAIGLAYPTDDSNQAGGLIPGLTALPATTILPPGTPGRMEFDTLGTGGEGNGDPEAARKLLEESDAVGTELKFYFQTDIPESVKSSEVVEAGLEKAGFKVTRLPTTSEEIRAKIDNPDAPVNMRGSGWCSDWPSGSSWFPAIMDGSLINPNDSPNMSFLDVPEVNKANDRILAMEDPAEAAEAWGELDKTIMEKYYPVVLRFYYGTAPIHGSRVGGMESDNTKGVPFFPEMYVIGE